MFETAYTVLRLLGLILNLPLEKSPEIMFVQVAPASIDLRIPTDVAIKSIFESDGLMIISPE